MTPHVTGTTMQSLTQEPAPVRVVTVALVSGLLGLTCGAFLQPTWQDVVEPAQVLAGVVTYPFDNPVFIYSTRTWTILHQVTALALFAGVQERALAIVFSGLLGLVSFQALGLTTLAMGARWPIAALSPVLVYASGATRFLPGYPVDVLGWPYTYGILSGSLLLLVLALLALQRERGAGLLLGVFPAIHVGMGAWAWVIVCILLAVTPSLRARLARAWPWLVAGLGLTMVSATTHLMWFLPPAPAAPDHFAALMRSVRANWDLHRAPLDWQSYSVMTGVALPVLCWLWQRRLGARLPGASSLLVKGFAIAAAIAVGADLALTVLPESIGAVLARPMPQRLLALPLLGGMAWIIGLTNGTKTAAVRTLAAGLFAALTLVHLHPAFGLPVPRDVLDLLGEHLLGNWATVAGAVMVSAALVITLGDALPVRWQRWCDGWPSRISQRTLNGVLVLMAALVVAAAVDSGPTNLAKVRDRTNDPLLATAASRRGLLLTAGDLHLIQAATRRPVLIDGGAIDTLVYVPAAAGAADHIATTVYGQPLTQPAPDDWGADGAFPPWLGHALWSERTPEEWAAIGREFGITDILTPADWTLHLPVVASDARYILWTLRDTEGSR